MAVDLERLVVQLSADLRGYENAMRRAQGVTTRSARQIESRFAQMNRNISAGTSGFLRGFVGALASGLSVQAVGKFIESAQKTENALRSAGLAGTELKAIYEQLFAVAQRHAVPIGALADLYGKLALSQKELGVSSQQLLSFLETISVALRVGGTASDKASDALRQLSQAMGGAVVRAEEFTSIQEGAPAILYAAAAGIKEAEGSVSKLRQIMLDGKLAAKALFDGIEAGRPVLEQRLVGAETTVSQHFVRLQNVLQDVAGKFNESAGATKLFGEAIDGVANELMAFDADNAVREIRKIIEAMGDGIDTAREFTSWLGHITGLEQIGGLVTGGTGFTEHIPGLQVTSQAGIQNRINEAFEGVDPRPLSNTLTEKLQESIDAATTLKTGRLPAAAAGVTPITLQNYPITGGAATDKVAKEALKAQERLLDALSRQAGIAVDAAEQLLGQHEVSNAGSINAFLKRGGVDLNAATTAWCAAFVNSALAQVGIKGTGSNVATSFANWGVQVNPADIQRGDVLLESRGKAAGQVGGHVGFATGGLRAMADGIVQIEMLSGNAANKVQKQWVDASDVVARRAQEGFAIAAQGLDNLVAELELRKEEATFIRDTMAAIKEKIELTQLETSLIGASNAEYERQMLIFETLNALRERGVEITDALRAAIEAEAAALYNQVAAADAAKAANESLQAAQERMASQAEDINQAVAGALSGLIKDLIAGRDASEALANALASVAEKLLDIALNNILGSLFGGGGGIGGMLMGILHQGGVAGQASQRRRVSPLVFAGAQRMHSGGLVGLRADEIPAILQRGEIVLPKGTRPGGDPRELHVTVGVSADNNGNLLPFVESVSRREAGRTTQRGLSQYDRQLDRTISSKMAQAQARQL